MILYLVISCSRGEYEIDDHIASLWGIELNYPGSDNSYLTEVAYELFDEALAQAKVVREKTIRAMDTKTAR